MNLTDKVTIPAQVMARQVGDEMVILDLASGTYFGMDPVGSRIWKVLSEGKTIGEICAILLEEYEVERERVEKDTFDLVKALAAQGLIELEGR